MTDKRLLDWLISGDTDTPSVTLLARMEDLTPVYRTHPYSAHEFGCCVRLLDTFPEYRARLDEMTDESVEWTALWVLWTALEDDYRAWWALKERARQYSEEHLHRDADRRRDRLTERIRAVVSVAREEVEA